MEMIVGKSRQGRVEYSSESKKSQSQEKRVLFTYQHAVVKAFRFKFSTWNIITCNFRYLRIFNTDQSFFYFDNFYFTLRA